MKRLAILLIILMSSVAYPMWYGEHNIGDYLTFAVNTSQFTTGAGFDSTSVPQYGIYEDETATEVVGPGAMAKLDDAGTIGFYTERVQLTEANFDVGKMYTIYITATVDGVAATTYHAFKMRAAPLALASGVLLADTDHTINSLTIDDDTGDAFTIITRGGNGNAVVVTGNGTGAAMLLTGGDTGHGLSVRGGTSGGQGINALARGGNGAGALFQGVGTGEGLDARGGDTGHGISGLGGASGGDGFHGKARANNDDGMELEKHGTGFDFNAVLSTNAITATVIATDAIGTSELATGAIGAAQVADAAWQELIELMFTFDATAIYGTQAGSVVDQIADNAGGSALTLSAIAEAVWTLFDRRTITGGGGRY